MRFLGLFLFLSFYLSLVSFTEAQEPQAATVPDLGLLIRPSGDGIRDERDLRAVATMSRLGIRRFVVELRAVDGTAYSSTVERRGYQTVANPPAALKAAMGSEEVEVWAMITTLPSFDARLANRPYTGSVLERVPSAASMTVTGDRTTTEGTMLLDPGAPETEAFLADLIAEVAALPEIDGIILDGFAYPTAEWGYNPTAVEDFRTVVGGAGPPPPDDEVWKAWRREQLTRLLESLGDALASTGRDLPLAVVVSADGQAPWSWDGWLRSNAYENHLQDWVRWAEQELVDEILLDRAVAGEGDEGPYAQWITFARAHGGSTTISGFIRGRTAIVTELLERVRTARFAAIPLVLSDYQNPVRQAIQGFYDQMLPQAFALNVNRLPAATPYPHVSAVPRFGPMANPPGSVGAIPTATPAPTFSLPRPVETLAPQPTAEPTAYPTPVPPTYRLFVMDNGQRVEGRVVLEDSARGTVRVETPTGSILTLERAKIVSEEELPASSTPGGGR